MKPALSVVALAAILTASQSSQAEERARPPSKGTGLLITGSVLLGVGLVTVISTPSICRNGTGAATTGVSTSGCNNVGYVFGAAFGAVGLPLMIVGLVKRSNYNAWLADHPVVSGLSLAPLAGGGALGWSTTF